MTWWLIHRRWRWFIEDEDCYSYTVFRHNEAWKGAEMLFVCFTAELPYSTHACTLRYPCQTVRQTPQTASVGVVFFSCFEFCGEWQVLFDKPGSGKNTSSWCKLHSWIVGYNVVGLQWPVFVDLSFHILEMIWVTNVCISYRGWLSFDSRF